MTYSLLLKELVDQYRTKKVAIIAIIFLFVAISSALVAKLLPDLAKSFQTPGMTLTIAETTPLDAIDQFVKNVAQMGVFILLFVVSGAMAEEKVRKTLELLLAKPVTRQAVVISKFFAYLGVVKVGLVLSGIVFAGYTYSLFGSFPVARFALVFILLLGYTLSTLAVTLAASTVARSSLAAAGIGFVWVVAQSIIGILMPSVGQYLPSAVTSIYRDILTTGWENTYLYSLLVSVAFILISAAVAIQRFRYTEIER